MPETLPSTPLSNKIPRQRAGDFTRVARVPYLNSAPFFEGLALGDGYLLTDAVPSELGRRAGAGEVDAGLLPLLDYLRLKETFGRLGHFGIAVHGRARSVMLFSCKPIRQLEGAVIAVTEETSTSAALLRLLLEKRYKVTPAAYEQRMHKEKREAVKPVTAERRRHPEADALLLIGDEALRFRQTNRQYPFEIDLAFEWWLWQHLPCVFAVWAARKALAAQDGKLLEASLAKALAVNTRRFAAIAEARATALGIPAAELSAYLTGFRYRFGPEEEAGIKKFEELIAQHGLIGHGYGSHLLRGH